MYLLNKRVTWGKDKISLTLGFADCTPSVSFCIMLYPQHLMQSLDLFQIIVLLSQKYIIGDEAGPVP